MDQSPQFRPLAYVPSTSHPPPPSPTPMREVPVHTTMVEETDNVRPITFSERLHRPPYAYVPTGSEEDPQEEQQEEESNSRPSTEEQEK